MFLKISHFAGTHLCRGLFFKKDYDKDVFLRILRKFKEHLFHRILPVAASESFHQTICSDMIWKKSTSEKSSFISNYTLKKNKYVDT